MSGALIAASSDGQTMLSTSALMILVAIVIVLTIVLVFALAWWDQRSEPLQDGSDTGLSLLDAT